MGELKVWRVECETAGREVYYVQAEDADDARTHWEESVEDGKIEPSVSEILSVEITSIEEASA